MGSTFAKTVRHNDHDVLRNARSVLSRRGAAKDDPGILGMVNKIRDSDHGSNEWS